MSAVRCETEIFMANTYTQIYIHLIFAVKNHESTIPLMHESRIHAYLGGIFKEHNHLPLAIGGTENHVHCLFRYNVNQTIPDLVRDLKTGTSKFISQYRLTLCKFEWQTGYGAFSYAPSQIERVRQYIENQHLHHKGITLQEEVRNILEKFGIEYDERYIFHEPV